jgi:LacI family transcriptional regulator
MPTINDVAKLAGVSTYTVSSVLNRSARVSPELTKRVLDAVRELDYTINSVARSLQTRKTQTIGMVLPNVANPFFARVVAGAEEICRAKGYTLLLGNTGEDPEQQSRCIASFRSKQADGLIVFMAAGTEESVSTILGKGTPVVAAGRLPATFETDSVTADNRMGAQLAVQHLLSQGHSRIGIITGPFALRLNEDRRDGWAATLDTAGLPAPDEFALETDWSAESGYLRTCELLQLPDRPTAIFISSLVLMIGSLRAIREKRLRCPQDVELICADNSEWLDVFDPPISAILQPSYEMGAAAAELLFRKIAEPDRAHETVILKPAIKVRTTQSAHSDAI